MNEEMANGSVGVIIKTEKGPKGKKVNQKIIFKTAAEDITNQGLRIKYPMTESHSGSNEALAALARFLLETRLAYSIPMFEVPSQPANDPLPSQIKRKYLKADSSDVKVMFAHDQVLRKGIKLPENSAQIRVNREKHDIDDEFGLNEASERVVRPKILKHKKSRKARRAKNTEAEVQEMVRRQIRNRK